MRACRFALLTLLLTTLSGCGTIFNLKDRPVGPMFVGTGCCYPFGGTVRSGLLAVMGPPCGLGEVINGNITITQGELGTGLKQVGNGLLITAAGLGAIVDCPLSLAGDIVTFPLAYARSKEYPWATWWGEKSLNLRPMAEPEDADKPVDGGTKSAD